MPSWCGRNLSTRETSGAAPAVPPHSSRHPANHPAAVRAFVIRGLLFLLHEPNAPGRVKEPFACASGLCPLPPSTQARRASEGFLHPCWRVVTCHLPSAVAIRRVDRKGEKYGTKRTRGNQDEPARVGWRRPAGQSACAGCPVRRRPAKL